MTLSVMLILYTSFGPVRHPLLTLLTYSNSRSSWSRLQRCVMDVSYGQAMGMRQGQQGQGMQGGIGQGMGQGMQQVSQNQSSQRIQREIHRHGQLTVQTVGPQTPSI